jgi:hypothetical protein
MLPNHPSASFSDNKIKRITFYLFFLPAQENINPSA